MRLRLASDRLFCIFILFETCEADTRLALMMEQYKSLWIAGTQATARPYKVFITRPGDVIYQRPDNSVVELIRFTVEFFKLITRRS